MQLSQHYHPEPPGEKDIPSPSVTSKLFPPSITFTWAPAAQVMLDTSLHALSPLRWTPTEARGRWKPAECDRSSEVLTETKSDTGKLYRSEEGHAGGRDYKQFHCFLHLWESDTSPSLACLLPDSFTTSPFHNSATAHCHSLQNTGDLLTTFFKIKSLMELALLWAGKSLPLFPFLRSFCSSFQVLHLKTHLNNITGEIKGLRGSNRGCTANKLSSDICG